MYILLFLIEHLLALYYDAIQNCKEDAEVILQSSRHLLICNAMRTAPTFSLYEHSFRTLH